MKFHRQEKKVRPIADSSRLSFLIKGVDLESEMRMERGRQAFEASSPRWAASQLNLSSGHGVVHGSNLKRDCFDYLFTPQAFIIYKSKSEQDNQKEENASYRFHGRVDYSTLSRLLPIYRTCLPERGYCWNSVLTSTLLFFVFVPRDYSIDRMPRKAAEGSLM